MIGIPYGSDSTLAKTQPEHRPPPPSLSRGEITSRDTIED